MLTYLIALASLDFFLDALTVPVSMLFCIRSSSLCLYSLNSLFSLTTFWYSLSYTLYLSLSPSNPLQMALKWLSWVLTYHFSWSLSSCNCLFWRAITPFLLASSLAKCPSVISLSTFSICRDSFSFLFSDCSCAIWVDFSWEALRSETNLNWIESTTWLSCCILLFATT